LEQKDIDVRFKFHFIIIINFFICTYKQVNVHDDRFMTPLHLALMHIDDIDSQLDLCDVIITTREC